MELRDFRRGVAPRTAPVIQKPPSFNVQRSPYAPAPRVPAVAPTQSKFGSPSAVGFNPETQETRYTKNYLTQNKIPSYTPPANTISKPLFPSQFPFQGSMGATTPLLGNSVKPNSIPPCLLRTLPDYAVDATGLGIVAPPLGAAAAAWGENAAQQYEMYTGDRKQKSPGEVALAGALGLLPALVGVVGKNVPTNISENARNAIVQYYNKLHETFWEQKLLRNPRANAGIENFIADAEKTIFKNADLAMQQPIAINTSQENATKILQDGFIKNIHYPGIRSSGAHIPTSRQNSEAELFNILYSPGQTVSNPLVHPIYGYSYNPDSAKNTSFYGDVTFLLKNALKDRAYYTAGDTGVMKYVQPAKYFTTNPQELRAAIGKLSGKMSRLETPDPYYGAFEIPYGTFNYPEAQILGGINLSDVEKIMHTPNWLFNSVNPDLNFREALTASGVPYLFRQAGEY